MIKARPYVECAAGKPSSIDTRVDAVMARLPQDLAFVQPKHIAPFLGLTDNGFTSRLRECPQTRSWQRGNYRFFLDDPQHVAMLRAAIKFALQTGRKLPAELRIH